ncbi:hypothetical protein QAD02_000138 [Eretmocerus hayati]|uniref:Uncharacterized protein n=1 Tax=Eretmocerus hayati TaxID=131215 RepID=A0ACC2NCU1_9HYME|nr:hypothetical protein QAD02_000138 [Eretmocerus hayati]
MRCICMIRVDYADLTVDASRSRKPRLVGAYPVSTNDHSYMASIQEYNKHFCAGTIYSQTIILTAAHCIIGKWYQALFVRVGSIYKDEHGQLIGVSKMNYHQDFMLWRQKNDIALIKLKEKIKLRELHPAVSVVKLLENHEKVRPGSLVTVVGWGIFDHREMFSDRLLELSMTTIPNEKCPNTLRDVRVSFGSDKQICAKCDLGKGCSCPGDSGGPVMFEGRQAGIISTGSCTNGRLELFPEISPYRDWIDDNEEDFDDTDQKPFIMHPSKNFNNVAEEDIMWNRFHRGRPIHIETASFLVAFLDKNNSLKCTGSIIGPKYVLTSASCAKKIDKTKHRVVAGSTNFRASGDQHHIIIIKSHENYRLDKFGRPINDIAVIEVDPPFNKNLKVAKLFAGEKISTDATVYGWNRINQKTSKDEFILKESSVQLLLVPGLPPHCGILSNEVKRAEGRICVKSLFEGMCISNDGGPLISGNYILGVTSWTYKKCENFWYPAVYSGVLFFQDWIHETMTKLRDELR